MDEQRQHLNKGRSSAGAHSIMKAPGIAAQDKRSTAVSYGQCLVYEYDRDPNVNEVAKKVDDKDISDMRDEKAKVRDLLQEKENEQLAMFKRLSDRRKITDEMASSPKVIK